MTWEKKDARKRETKHEQKPKIVCAKENVKEKTKPRWTRHLDSMELGDKREILEILGCLLHRYDIRLV
jgi:hypothetical protein